MRAVEDVEDAIRSLEYDDINKGFLELMAQLTTAPRVSDAIFRGVRVRAGVCACVAARESIN